jgi:polygalacturonase
MISGITMRNITTTPIFLRLGSRLSGPKGITTGTMKRITISNVVSYNSESEYAAIVCGIPGHLIEDVKFDNIYLHHRGGGTEKMAGLYPPEAESTYPEPKMFGTLPAHGFFIRHARNIDLTGIEIAVERPDARPAIWLEDVYDAAVMRLKIPREPHTTALMLQNCHQISIHGSKGISDMDISDVVRQKI